MNAGGTMLRVYDALKERIMAGAFVPGERLEPARLADEHLASVTPVRDALHRLAGERLIESWQQEGFRQPLVTEASLRDLYAWNGELVDIALKRDAVISASSLSPDHDYAGGIAALFRTIARFSPNRELWHAVDNVTDRLHRARLVEAGMFDDSAETLSGISAAFADRTLLRRRIAAMHRQRLRHVGSIAAAMRPRDDRA